MSWDDKADTTIYEVVVNQEQQYSIWPAGRELPMGWQTAGKSGTKAECAEYIKEMWTYIHPRSLRSMKDEPAGE